MYINIVNTRVTPYTITTLKYELSFTLIQIQEYGSSMYVFKPRDIMGTGNDLLEYLFRELRWLHDFIVVIF